MIALNDLGLTDLSLYDLATHETCQNSTEMPKTTCFAYSAILHPLPMP
ncbi:hypothetical protein [Novosphingobium sp. AAP83]|nr:hypothetical protein [Novosphingobium sp. AAP83]